MEKKIGEIFEHNGEWYQCVKSDGTCNGCVGKFQPYSFCNGFKECVGKIFKKLEKVGEPYIIGDKLIQRYKIYPTTFNINVYDWYYQNLDVQSWTIDIEIKQNKEDMEEKKIQHYDCFFDRKSPTSNLKPFDLKSAKAGEPVCTRDGRKARIICFDRKDNTPIVALIECVNGAEILQCYHNNGKCYHYESSDYDLMMLPEKKEGWVNVYRDGLLGARAYNTKKEALDNASPCDYVDTVKIEWNE